MGVFVLLVIEFVSLKWNAMYHLAVGKVKYRFNFDTEHLILCFFNIKIQM